MLKVANKVLLGKKSISIFLRHLTKTQTYISKKCEFLTSVLLFTRSVIQVATKSYKIIMLKYIPHSNHVEYMYTMQGNILPNLVYVYQ